MNFLQRKKLKLKQSKIFAIINNYWQWQTIDDKIYLTVKRTKLRFKAKLIFSFAILLLFGVIES